MANALITPTMVTREALRVLHQKLNFIGSIHRDYDKQFAKEGAKIGQTLQIRLPNEYVVRTGRQMAAQDTTEQTTALTVATQQGVDMYFTSSELTLSLDDFSDRIIEPAIARLASTIEANAMSMALSCHRQVTNAGAAATYNGVLDGKKILTDQLAPVSKRIANLNTLDSVNIVKDTKTLFNNQSEIGDQYREGMMGRAGGFDFYENTLWPGFTPGTHAGYTVNGAGQTGNTLAVSAGTGTMVVGDVFTIAGVFRCHPETKQSTTELHQFVVTQAYAGGAGTINFQPAIVLTGAKQNVVAGPAASAAIVFAGTAGTQSGMSLLYHKDAFAFVTADLEMPNGVDWKARETQDGISMRIVRDYNISDDSLPCRIDVLYGFNAIRPALACRYVNS